MDSSIEPAGARNEMSAEEQHREAPKSHTIGVQLGASGQPDVPILANFARVQMSAPAAIVDFGFLEPDALDALARVARKGGKMPPAIRGRLAARLALSPEALATLHQQLGQALAILGSRREGK
jgi:hypothetical protein